MRKEYIMTEEEKMLKRRKIEENRARRLSSASDDMSSHVLVSLLLAWYLGTYVAILHDGELVQLQTFKIG